MISLCFQIPAEVWSFGWVLGVQLPPKTRCLERKPRDRYQKWPCLKPEIHVPRPIIFGINSLDFWGVNYHTELNRILKGRGW